MSERIFRSSDPDFPTTPAAQAALRAAGRVDDGPRRPAAPFRVVPAPSAATVGDPPADSLDLGQGDRAPVYLSVPKLMAGRLLVQGSSGAGKSQTIRRIVEGAHAHLTTVIVDPEGEFENLGVHIGATRLSGADLASDALTATALACRQHRLPLHLDLSDMEPDQRILRAAAFFSGLLSAPREHWSHTVLVAVDEAHLLAPHLAASARDAETRRAGVAALTDLCSRGRKRGIGAVIATQRLAKLATSVVSELHNVLLGLNVFDRDIARGGDLLGWTYDKAATMRDLRPGEFMALGPALCRLPQKVKVGPTLTAHSGAAPGLTPSSGMGASEARGLLGLDGLAGSGRAAADPVARGGKPLDTFLLEAAAPEAARIVAALRVISPNATTAADLSRHLSASPEAIHAALDLLLAIGVVDTVPKGEERIARLAARLRARLHETPVVGLA